MKLFKTKAVAVACSVLMMAGCGDIVIKVQKKPKNVDTSAMSNFNALNLDDPTKADFLKHLDGLKYLAIDLLFKELNKHDYRRETRDAIRKYQDFLIAKASGPISIDDSFYADAAECRESGLNFNMFQANDMFGIILKTVVLSKLSEINAGKINPHLSKEIQAIGQIILKELGLKLDGNVDVVKDGDVTTTTGDLTLQITAIAGEEISEEQKAKDEAQVLKINFERVLGANYVGHFNSTISISHLDSEGKKVVHAGKLNVKREAVEEMFVHTVSFEIGVEGGATAYSRELVFKQMPANKKQIQVMDTVNPKNPDLKKTYVTLIDLEAGTQCKLVLGEEPAGTSTATATETATATNTATATDTATATATDTATATSTATQTSTATDTSTSTDSGDSGDDKGGDDSDAPPADGGDGKGGDDGDDSSAPPADGKGNDGKGDDDEDLPGDGKGDDGNKPGQTPGQTPTQTPTQSK